VWAVGRLGVAACVAAAVDRQARQSCLVWSGGVNWLLFSFTPQQQQQQQWRRTRVPRSDWLARVVVVVVFFARADGECFFHGRVRNIHATALPPAVML